MERKGGNSLFREDMIIYENPTKSVQNDITTKK